MPASIGAAKRDESGSSHKESERRTNKMERENVLRAVFHSHESGANAVAAAATRLNAN